jgi:hypothetical protein
MADPGNKPTSDSPAPSTPNPGPQVPAPDPLENVINTPVGGSGGAFSIIEKPKPNDPDIFKI